VFGVNYVSTRGASLRNVTKSMDVVGWGDAERRNAAEGVSPLAACFLGIQEEEPGRWESGKPAFGFPLFHPPQSSELWECGNLAGLWRDSQGARGKRGKPAFGFPRFPQPRHFHSSPNAQARGTVATVRPKRVNGGQYSERPRIGPASVRMVRRPARSSARIRL
jgi:hypothetical protein